MAAILEFVPDAWLFTSHFLFAFKHILYFWNPEMVLGWMLGIVLDKGTKVKALRYDVLYVSG